MNYLPRWNRTAGHARRRLRNSSSELAIEFAEPRLLLSGVKLGIDAAAATAAATGVVHALENNVAQLGHLLGGLENSSAGGFEKALPLVSQASNLPALTLATLQDSAHDKLLDLDKLIHDTFVAPLQAQITDFSVFQDTGDIQAKLQTTLQSLFGPGFLVVDHSTSQNVPDPNDPNHVNQIAVLKDAIFDFTLPFKPFEPYSFVLDFNKIVDVDSALKLPVIHGNLDLSQTLTLTTDYDANTHAFVMVDAHSATTFTASATMPNNIKLEFGLLSLQTTAATVMSYTGTIDVTLAHNLAETALLAAATASQAPSYAIPANVGTSVDTASNFTFDLPLALSQDILQIPGFTNLPGHLVFTGNPFNAQGVIAHFTGFDALDNLAKMSSGDLLSMLATVDGYINQLTHSSLLNIDLPFTDGATVGDLINFASAFQHDVIDKLGPVDKTVGAVNPVIQKAANNTDTASVFIKPIADSLATLPENFRIAVDFNGHSLNIDVTNHFVDSPNHVATITSVAQLAAAINAALPAALLAAGLPANDQSLTVRVDLNDSTRIEFKAAATNVANPPANTPVNLPANVSVHASGPSFTSLVTFAENLAGVLGYGDLVSFVSNGVQPVQGLHDLLSTIGIHFDASAGGILRFQLDYSTLITALSQNLTFSAGFDLGDLAGLKLNNGVFTFDATAGASMTLGIQIPSGSSTPVADTTELEDLPVWPAGLVTADEIGSQGTVARADLGLAGNGVISLSQFLTVSASGGQLVFTASESAFRPASLQQPTILLQDTAVAPQSGLATLGFASGQAWIEDAGHTTLTLNAAGAVGSGHFGDEFAFSIVINGHAVKIHLAADAARDTLGELVDAINNAIKPTSGFADMKVYLRDGSIGTIELQPAPTALNPDAQKLIVTKDGAPLADVAGSSTDHKVTLGDLRAALAEIGVSTTYTAQSGVLAITDNTAAHPELSPEALGFAANQSAVAEKVNSHEYKAELKADPSVVARLNLASSTPDYARGADFLLTLGTLDPIKIHIAAGAATDAATYAAAINTALALVNADLATLGLPATHAPVKFSDLVHADVYAVPVVGSMLKLTTTMHNVPEIIADATDSTLRQAAKFGLSISPVDLRIWSTNGSQLGTALGIAGYDKFGLIDLKSPTHPNPATPLGEIDSRPLQGGTLADRIFLENASVYAGLHLHFAGDLEATLGFLGLTANATGDIFLKTTLALQNPDGGSTLTFHTISDAFAAGEVSNLWSLEVGSGSPDVPWAALHISNIQINGAGSIAGLAGVFDATGAIDIVLGNELHSLGDLLNARPEISFTGLTAPDLQNLDFGKIISGIRTVLTLLNDNVGSGGIMTTELPLIGVNLESILNFTQNFANFIDELQQHPASAIDQVSKAIQDALGTTAISLSLSGSDLLLNFNIKPLSVSQTLPVTLDLKSLAAEAGITLPSGVADLASATGMLAITAGATIGISIGVRVGALLPQDTSKLSDLNKGAGVKGDGTSAKDLSFVLADGRSFSIDLDALSPNLTLDQLADAINQEAANANIIGFVASALRDTGGNYTGQLSFLDTTSVVTSVAGTKLADLGFDTNHRVAAPDPNDATRLVLNAGALPGGFDATQEYAFKLLINGHAITVDVPSSTTYTSANFDEAINAALASITVDRASLDLTGTGTVTLDKLVSVDTQSGHLQLSAKIADIASTIASPTLAVSDLRPASLSELITQGPSQAAGGGILSTIAATLADTTPEAFRQAYQFDVLLNGHAVTIDIPESSTRSTAAALTSAINAALGDTLVDRTAIGLTGGGKISVGQIVTVSFSGTDTLTFTASNAKLGSTPTFALDDTVLPAPKTSFEVIDLNNSGGAAQLGFGTANPLGLGLKTLGVDAAHEAGVVDPNNSANYQVTMTPPAAVDFTKAFAFDLVIDGHPITLSIAADSSRLDTAGMAKAINTALAKLSADRTDFGLAGSGTVTFDKLVNATSDATHIYLNAKISGLAPASGSETSLAVKNVAVAAAADVEDNGDIHSVTGTALQIANDSERFFVNTSLPDPQHNIAGTGILVSVQVSATNLNFSTSFGPLAASIENGTAFLGSGTDHNGNFANAKLPNGDVNADFHADQHPATLSIGLSGANHLAFTTLASTPIADLIDFRTNVAISVDLPVVLVGIPIGDVTIKISDILESHGSTEVFMSLPTDFAKNFSAFNFLNNPQAIINGLDAMLGATGAAFQAKVFGFKLPLIGDALASAGDFIEDFRSNVIGYLQGLVDDYISIHPGEQPTTASIISDGLSSLLATLGFTAPTGVSQMVKSDVDVANETITFDVDISKILFTGAIDMSADLGIPGLGINISNGKIDLQLLLSMDLQFGFAASGPNKGFFFNDTLAGTHALAVHFSALPQSNFNATATVGILTMSATNKDQNSTVPGVLPGGTALTGDVFVDLHPKANATLFDLGFTQSGAALAETHLNNVHKILAGEAPTLDGAGAKPELIFNLSVNGHLYKIDVPSGWAGATTLDGAINTQMAHVTVHKADIGQGSGDVALSTLVTAHIESSGKVSFSANDSAIGADGKLTIDDIKLLISDVPKSLRVDLQAAADLDLKLDAKLDVGGGIGLPSVSTELLFQYKFAKLFTGFDDGTFESGIVTPLTFHNVELDAGSFLSSFLKPILDIAWDIIGPIRPILDFITSPLPGISDLMGSPTSLIDLAQLLGGENPQVRSIIAAVRMIDQVADLIATIEGMTSGGGNLVLNFGDYVFGPAAAGQHSLGDTLDPFNPATSVKNAHISTSLESVPAAQDGNNPNAKKALGQLGELGVTTQGNGKLSLPLLENPVGALKLLTGQLDGIDLFTWELPTFVVGFSGGKTFPVAGIPVGLEAGLGINFSAALHIKFGYDTSGFIEFQKSNNPIFLLDGFYVDNTLGPQLITHFGISASAGLNLVLAKAGVTGEVAGDFDFTLLDPNNDGRVRPTEILDTLLTDPLHIFVIHGRITANVSVYYWVGVDYLLGTITLYEGSYTLVNATLVDFTVAPNPHAVLAAKDASGALNIDMGPLADQRSDAGDNVDGNENFEIRRTTNGGAGDITVIYHHSSRDFSQTFTGVTSINVDGGIGNNIITLTDIDIPMLVNAGDGNNTINIASSSSGASTITLGDGNNNVTGGSGVDTITAGDGSNTILGGDGDDVILAGAGANFIKGEGGSDKITAGAGRNALIGGTGGDTIKAGSGRNIVFGGTADTDTETALKSAITSYGLLTPAEQQDTPAFSTLNAMLVADGTNDGDNFIRLGGGANIVFGGSGKDFITAGSGDNVVLGDVGRVNLVNGALESAQSQDRAGTVLTAGDNDSVVLGVGTTPNAQIDVNPNANPDPAHLPAPKGAGNQIIIGGAGVDLLIGTNGSNIIIGDLGSVQGPAASANGAFETKTLTDTLHVGNNDTIVAGVGSDALLGGTGNDTIIAGPGADFVAGDNATLTRTAVFGSGALLVAFESTDETAARASVNGNDYIDVATGNDLVIGGGGSDIILGGSGNNTLLGDFGKIIPTDGTNADVVGRGTASGNGDDTITATNGTNAVMGGGGGDTITVGDGTNVIFGDSGSIKRAISGKDLIALQAHVVDFADGGDDTVTSGRGSNIVVGGKGADHLTAGGGDNVLLGDFGTYLRPDGTITDVTSTDTNSTANGNDTITVAGGTTVAIGGGGDDTIIANKPTALDDLLGAAPGDRVGIDNGTAVVVSAAVPATPPFNLATRYTFDVVLNGHEFTVDVGSDTGRTSFADVVSAINASLSKITPLKSVLGLPGADNIALSEFVKVAILNGTTVTFSVDDAKLATISGTPSFLLRDAPSVNVLFGDGGQVVRNTDLSLVTAETIDGANGGTDAITLNYGKNVAFGGAGADTVQIHGVGTNVVLGDNGKVKTAAGLNPDVVTASNLGTQGNDTITIFADASANNVILGGGGSDAITINGAGNNVALGDAGEVTRAAGTLAFISASTQDSQQTLDETIGAADTITVGAAANGNNVLIGGADGDTLTVNGTGKNIVLGDLGTVTAATTTSDDIVTSRNVGIGGADIITVTSSASGANILIGGGNSDHIAISGTGGNVAFGDGGVVKRALGTLALISADVFQGSVGANDVILVDGTGGNHGDGDNILIGGAGQDSFTIKGDGRNIVIGDVGKVIAATANTPDTVEAYNTSIGDADTVTVAANADGANILIGGAKGDLLTVDGTGDNVIFGDSGRVLRMAATLAFISAETVEEALGGADSVTINGPGKNIALGGTDSDTIVIAGSGNNIALGDLGLVRAIDGINADVVGRNTAIGAADNFTLSSTASGNNIVMGETGDENIVSDATGFNIFFGDTGEVTRTAGGSQLISVKSVEAALGGVDAITASAGSNIIIGGAKGDILRAADGIDYIVGDAGAFAYLNGVRSELRSTDFTVAGDDQINAGGGENYAIGGGGNDQITGNAGADVIVGDQGVITWDPSGVITKAASLFDVNATEGTDTIRAGEGDNRVIGGGKGDSITSGSGNDFIVGDNGLITFSGGVLTQVSSADPSIAGDDSIDAGNGNNNVVASGGNDIVDVLDGNDNLIGDNGAITFAAGVRIAMTSTDLAVAGNDALHAGEGDNTVIGGGGKDTITTGAGTDIAIGDHGAVTWDAAGTLLVVSSLLDAAGTPNDDTINVGNGTNYVIGGGANDVLTGGEDGDYVIGDNGSITLVNGIRFQMTSADFAVTGNDVINAAGGENYVIAGGGDDGVTGNAGMDVIIGDQGVITWDATGTLQSLASLLNISATDGNDTINAGDGTNYIIGGGANDMLTGASGRDYVIGDNGSIALVNGITRQMTSSDFTVAGNDVIDVGNGQNYVIGGGGNDIITAGDDRDQLIGDQGFVTWNADGTRHEVSSLFEQTQTAGTELIHGGGGNDNIIGGLNADELFGDDGNDIVFGDDGHILFLNDQEIMAETLDQHSGTGDIIHGDAGNNFLFGGEKNNFFYANPLMDLIVIMDGHIDISPDRKVLLNIPPFFGDPMLTPLGQSLVLDSPTEHSNGLSIFALVRPAGSIDTGANLLFGTESEDGSTLILSTLSGQPKSAFNLHGLLSSGVLGASLLNLLAIGPTGLIEAVTIGDVLDSQQQDGGTESPQAWHLEPGDIALPQAAANDDAADARVAHRAPPTATVLTFAPPAEAVEAAPAARIYDEDRGIWIPDVAAAGPRLILNGADLPELDLSGEVTMAA